MISVTKRVMFLATYFSHNTLLSHTKHSPKPLKTGLDVDKDTIIELACILTNGELETIEQGPEIAIHHPDTILDHMNEWCMEHHTASGLVARCKASEVTLAQAEQQVMEFVSRHAEAGQALFAGNSVHVDVAFVRKHMPKLYEYMHYRIVDVSTVKELARRWFPKECSRAPRKTLAHTALSDIKESIEELKYLRKAVFKQGGGGEEAKGKRGR